MAHEDKKTGTWIGDSRVTGFPRKFKRGFQTREEARAWEKARRERKLNPPPKDTRMKTSEACLAYLNNCDRKGYQTNTIRYKAKYLKDFLTYLETDPPVDSIDENVVESFLDYIFDIKNGKTANTYLKELKAFFRYLLKRRRIHFNPTFPIEKYDEEPFIKYVPPGEDILKVIELAGDEEKTILTTILHSAARSGEIRRMKFSDINFQENGLTLWTRKRKGGKLESNQIDMSKTLVAILKKQVKKRIDRCPYVFPSEDGKKKPKSDMDELLPALCEKAKIRPFNLHAIRHYVAVQLAYRLSLTEVQQFLRHKRATTTDDYLKSMIQFKSTQPSVLDDIEKSMKDNTPQVNRKSFVEALKHDED